MKTKEEIFKLRDCCICDNTRKVAFDDDVYKNKYRACSCTKYQKNLNLLKKSRIPDCYISFEFNDYIHTVYDLFDVDNKIINQEDTDENEKSYNHLTKLMSDHRDIYNDAIDILLSGGCSTGKTLLATSFLKNLILIGGYSGVFVTSEELITLANEKNNYNGDRELSGGYTLENLIDVDFLLIDGFEEFALLELNKNSMTKITINKFLKERKFNKKSFILTSGMVLTKLVSKGTVPGMVYTIVEIQLRGKNTKMIRSNILDKYILKK